MKNYIFLKDGEIISSSFSVELSDAYLQDCANQGIDIKEVPDEYKSEQRNLNIDINTKNIYVDEELKEKREKLKQKPSLEEMVTALVLNDTEKLTQYKTILEELLNG